MEIALNLMAIAKVCFFLLGSVLLTVVCLAPINDQPTSRIQIVFWTLLEAVFFAVVFGFVSFKIVS